MTALDRLRMLCVADVMTRDVVKLSSRETMLDVSRKFVEHDVVAAPVIDESGRCVGFFSAADFLRRELKTAPGIVCGGRRDGDQCRTSGSRKPLHEQHGASLNPGEPLLDAARIMCEQHLHRLPVVDDGGRVVGIVSTMDVVAALVNAIDEMEVNRF